LPFPNFNINNFYFEEKYINTLKTHIKEKTWKVSTPKERIGVTKLKQITLNIFFNEKSTMTSGKPLINYHLQLILIALCLMKTQ